MPTQRKAEEREKKDLVVMHEFGRLTSKKETEGSPCEESPPRDKDPDCIFLRISCIAAVELHAHT